MINLREETLVNYDSRSLKTRGIFEVDEQVGYVELENSKGSWKGFVPKSTEIFEFENGRLVAPSGREIPSSVQKKTYPIWIIIALVVFALILWMVMKNLGWIS
jgi:hypothetical protein